MATNEDDGSIIYSPKIKKINYTLSHKNTVDTKIYDSMLTLTAQNHET